MERSCEWCGKVFGAERRWDAKTCSVECSVHRHNERQRASQAVLYEQRKQLRAPSPDIACQHCGVTFAPYRASSKFCSRRCQWNFKTRAKRPRFRPCSKCGVDTPTRPGVPVCDDCKVDARRDTSKTQAKERARTLRAYGITEDEYDGMLAQQQGGCAICGRPDPGRHLQTFFSIDHCHTSGAVRGLLCHPCNLGIGYLQDNPEIMRAAADYVAARSPIREAPQCLYSV